MEDFIFDATTKVYFGRNKEENIGEILKEYKVKKILIHYGKSSIKKSGLLDRVLSKLKAYNIPYVELAGVEANPKLSLVLTGIKIVKEQGIDFILAIGGGSVLDSAKAIAAGSLVDHSPWLFSLHKMTPKNALPMGAILTIAASGSDMSNSCVITNDLTKEKRGYNSPFNRPKFAILNPELTYTVSAYQTACGIVDIMMHTLERFVSKGSETPLTDQIAIGLLKSVFEAGKIVMKDPKNYEARATLLWANSLSHNGLTSCGRSFIMSVHQLEHEVSGMFDSIAHGAGLAVLWPAWATFAYPFAKERFKKLTYEFLEIPASNDENDDIEKGIQKLKNYFKEIGMPTSLKELGIPIDALKDLAYNVTFQHTRVIKDVIEIDEATAYNIFKAAF